MLSLESGKIPSSGLNLLAVCDEKGSVYLAGTHLRIFNAGPAVSNSLLGDVLLSQFVVRYGVLPDGSIRVKYPPPSNPRLKLPSSEHFSHEEKRFPKTDPILTESQLEAIPGVLWSESLDTAKNKQEFHLSAGTTITKSIVGSGIADVFNRLMPTILAPANPDATSTIESDKDGVLSSVFDRNSLFFLYREYDQSFLRRFRLVEENEASAEVPSRH